MTSTHATLGHGASQVEPLSTGQELLDVLEDVLLELEDVLVDEPDVDVLLEPEVAPDDEPDDELEEDESVELDPPERESVR